MYKLVTGIYTVMCSISILSAGDEEECWKRTEIIKNGWTVYTIA